MPIREIKYPDAVPESEFSTTFVQGMQDRMSMSFFKYKHVAAAYPKKVSAIESLLVRLIRYMGIEAFQNAADSAMAKCAHAGDGNTEWLMDAGNFAMIEFMHPSLPNAHFESTDSKSSPGRVWRGEVDLSHRTNAGEN